MRLMHLSDSHGKIQELDDNFDMIVHSGDLMPNITRGHKHIEEAYQEEWLEDNASRIKYLWANDKPFIYCSSNHDYADPVPALRDAGVDAYNCSEQLLTINGVKYYGLPFTKYYNGEWNYELQEHEIAHKLKPVTELIESGDIDVLVSHGPMYGFLDMNKYGEHCGSQALYHMIGNLYRPLKALLVGHIHESAGRTTFHKTIVSNAACVQHIITI